MRRIGGDFILLLAGQATWRSIRRDPKGKRIRCLLTVRLACAEFCEFTIQPRIQLNFLARHIFGKLWPTEGIRYPEVKYERQLIVDNGLLSMLIEFRIFSPRISLPITRRCCNLAFHPSAKTLKIFPAVLNKTKGNVKGREGLKDELFQLNAAQRNLR